jgi:hypothetical protein
MEDAGNTVKTKEKKQESECCSASENPAFLSAQAISRDDILQEKGIGEPTYIANL